ncbi:MAG: DUF1570 domain-containing protein [Planctomycetaceae bacterium]|nr:DUF1570 domain-containing protein [Planctomycetaceae bacterium]
MISADRSAVLTCLALLLLNAGCVRTLVNRRLDRPDRYTIVRDQLVIHCDFEVPARHRLLDELTARREDLRRELAYASSEEPIHVYLFEDANRFKEFVREEHPGFPNRRAFFVESDTRLEVYAHWGGYVGEDLRHEVTHAYLHSVLPDIPLWLDEGLAEYFEVPRGRHGLNRDHLVRILARDDATAADSSSARPPRERLYRLPNLARLESLDSEQVLPQDDYAECWAWVHFLLESSTETKTLLREYLYRLHVDGSTVPLSSRMAWRLGLTADQLADRMAEHILETARSAGFTDSAGGAPAREERPDTLGSSDVQ